MKPSKRTLREKERENAELWDRGAPKFETWKAEASMKKEWTSPYSKPDTAIKGQQTRTALSLETKLR